MIKEKCDRKCESCSWQQMLYCSVQMSVKCQDALTSLEQKVDSFVREDTIIPMQQDEKVEPEEE